MSLSPIWSFFIILDGKFLLGVLTTLISHLHTNLRAKLYGYSYSVSLNDTYNPIHIFEISSLTAEVLSIWLSVFREKSHSFWLFKGANKLRELRIIGTSRCNKSTERLKGSPNHNLPLAAGFYRVVFPSEADKSAGETSFRFYFLRGRAISLCYQIYHKIHDRFSCFNLLKHKFAQRTYMLLL